MEFELVSLIGVSVAGFTYIGVKARKVASQIADLRGELSNAHQTLHFIDARLFSFHNTVTEKLEHLDAQIADVREDLQEKSIDPQLREKLSLAEAERMERDEDFDSRISEMKEQLAMTRDIVKGSGIAADELHPLVSNLPHTIIAEEHGRFPDVEVAN